MNLLCGGFFKPMQTTKLSERRKVCPDRDRPNSKTHHEHSTKPSLDVWAAGLSGT